MAPILSNAQSNTNTQLIWSGQPDAAPAGQAESAPTFAPTFTAASEDTSVSSSRNRSYMLWIDGVGAWQLCAGHSFTIGAPSFEAAPADVVLLANISRHHAALHYQSDTWSVTASQSTSVSGRTVDSPTALRSGDQLCLAERVRLGFRVPTTLSSSAVIDFQSNHRPTHTVDGIILMVDHCLLGPRRDHHVCCPDWPDVVVLYDQDDALRCRSSIALCVNGRPVSDSVSLKSGSVVTGDELRFRVEEMSWDASSLR